jgi:hypothetical protein
VAFSYQRVVNATIAIKLLIIMPDGERNKDAKTAADIEKSVLVRLAECAKSALAKARRYRASGMSRPAKFVLIGAFWPRLRPSPKAAISLIARAQRGALGDRGHGGRAGRLS